MQTIRNLLTVTALTMAFTGTIVAGTCGKACESSYPVNAKAPAVKEDIVAVAQEAGAFKTLVAAVQAAGLVETLQGKGPFTVFAPTDEAFGKLAAGTVESLLKPENRAQLTAILTYHVLPGQVLAADVKTMSAKTVNGQELAIKAGANGVTVNGANVVKTDVMASNGVIHVIDSVILPK
jgi:uncharacterized surface protein with fasciclin (FAS1) repeats